MPTELERRLTLASGLRANLTESAAAYLEGLGSVEDAPLLFFHAIAALHAPVYRDENGGALRQDWPRVPLPAARELLEASAGLGRAVAALLDPERSVPGVTTGAIRPELRLIAPISRGDGKPIQAAAGDLDITANWGYAGRGGITMPGGGKLVARDYTADERAALVSGAAAQGVDEVQALALLGEATCDVYLNGAAYWRNVPQRVWEYTIGGYQVIKKWLSYRERDLLGRALSPEEAREVTAIARRIAALLLLAPQLDANYRAVAATTYPWKT